MTKLVQSVVGQGRCRILLSMSSLNKVRKLLPGASDEKAHGLCRSISAEDCIIPSRNRTGEALILMVSEAVTCRLNASQ